MVEIVKQAKYPKGSLQLVKFTSSGRYATRVFSHGTIIAFKEVSNKSKVEAVKDYEDDLANITEIIADAITKRYAK